MQQMPGLDFDKMKELLLLMKIDVSCGDDMRV